MTNRAYLVAWAVAFAVTTALLWTLPLPLWVRYNVLTTVDLAALAVGVTILRKVTQQVTDTGDAIKQAVTENIDKAKGEAVARFTEAIGPALGHLATVVPGLIRDAIRDVRVTGSGQVELSHGDDDAGLHVVPDDAGGGTGG